MHTNIVASQETAEAEMGELLNTLSLPDIISILTNLAASLPEEQKEFYMSEIAMWGALGKKKVLINDIIDLVPAEDALNAVDEMMPVQGQEKPGGRYYPRPDQQEVGWSPETLPERPHRAPGAPEIKPEVERVEQHPEQDYIDPDLWEELTPPGPPPPQVALPDFAAMSPEDQEEYRKLMISQIYNAVRTAGQTNLPYPFVAEMMARYLDAVDPELLSKLIQDGVFSRSRFGFRWDTVVKNMFKHPSMTLEDLYIYWNAIVNDRMLPWVNGDWTVKRYGGGERGKNIEPLFEDWSSIPSTGPGIDFPEAVSFIEDPVTPEWHSEVHGPTGK